MALDAYQIRNRWAPPPHIAGICTPSQRILERQASEDMWALLREVDRLNVEGATMRTAIRLEWLCHSEYMYYLILHTYGVHKKIMLVCAVPEESGWAYMLDGKLIGPVSKEEVMLKAKEYVQSVNLPCEVPSFPEIPDAC